MIAASADGIDFEVLERVVRETALSTAASLLAARLNADLSYGDVETRIGNAKKTAEKYGSTLDSKHGCCGPLHRHAEVGSHEQGVPARIQREPARLA